MVSSYSFRTCWAEREDKLVKSLVQAWEQGKHGQGRFCFAAYLASGRALVSFPSMIHM